VQGINFLPKPYDFTSLLKAVRSCLDGGKFGPTEIRSETEAATAAMALR
jgi:DNA-binding NarL/FixJ family response regulator